MRNTLSPVTSLDVSDFCPKISANQLPQGRAALGEALSKWYARAEQDLVYTLGSDKGVRGRGKPAEMIQVSLLNTFKNCNRGSSLLSKSLRWAQLRFLEFAQATELWCAAVMYPATVTTRQRVLDLIRATVVNGCVKSPLHKYELTCKRKHHNKFKSICKQLSHFISITGFRRPNCDMGAALVARCNLCAEQALTDAKKEEDLDFSNSQHSWKLWITKAAESSASAGHKYVKASLGLNHDDYIGSKLSRAQVLDEEVVKWSRLWQEGVPVDPVDFGNVPKLAPLSVHQVQQAARSFKRKTCALGGFHPRHVALLSEDAVECLILIFHAAELLGELPPQLLETYIALLPEPTSGNRPIGWCQSLYRVWAKARSSIVKDWEQDRTAHLGFASCRNRSPVDVVWRHSAAAEFAKEQKSAFVCLLWDILKCYELIRHQDLVTAARRHNYPIAILRLTITSYMAPRRITMAGVVSRPIFPTRGIIAGVTTATSELRLLLMDIAQFHKSHHPNVNLNIVIDDLSLDTTNVSGRGAIEDITEAANDILHGLECLSLPVAKEKSAVLSNCRQVAHAVRCQLRDLGGPPLGCVRSLGIDFWAGGKRSKTKYMPIRSSRWKKMADRKSRLQILKRSSKQLAAKVFLCGDIPSVLYDAPVYGLFNGPLRALRREAGMIQGILGKKRDPDLAFSFYPKSDPEIRVAIAVISKFCGEVWNAALPPGIRDPAGLSLGALARGLEGFITRHGKSNPRKVEGPISALFKMLRKYGWSFHAPFILQDKCGNLIHLLGQCPRRVVALFRDDVSATIERRAIVRMHMKHASE